MIMKNIVRKLGKKDRGGGGGKDLGSKNRSYVHQFFRYKRTPGPKKSLEDAPDG